MLVQCSKLGLTRMNFLSVIRLSVSVASCDDGSLALAAMTTGTVSLFHPINATVLILFWNFGVTALLLVFSGLYGKRQFEWLARSG